ncbi:MULTISPECIES: hypothetical protein [unclassified Amycolatopsis]|uniref:hypothetical protein n=1 Tax=unclassified Amycolatopsis TaxID=2618356 RepID=UPI002876C868|nr:MULTISPECIES: hypothetical protein [unclassified Amycolatopsis]MDS0135850.1 hypothetical protein [Amycolatopsis sp. 505]MDS0149680.1 hypothetical protein [Amycolatopsis sp. CM201R]
MPHEVPARQPVDEDRDERPETRQEPPRRNDPQGPLEDDQARSREGHPSGNENFRGEP